MSSVHQVIYERLSNLCREILHMLHSPMLGCWLHNQSIAAKKIQHVTNWSEIVDNNNSLRISFSNALSNYYVARRVGGRIPKTQI